MKIDKNFTILGEYALEQNALEQDEIHYDLHNDYDFVSFNRNVIDNSIDLVFHKKNREWVRDDLAKSIKLRFFEPLFLRSSDNFFTTKHTSIYLIGYATLETIDDYFIEEDQLSEFDENDCIYLYMDLYSNSPLPNSHIMIMSKKIRLINEDNNLKDI